MTRTLLLTAGLLAVVAGRADAQSRIAPNVRPPALSPYLNLIRGGNPAANYFLGVVPEKERRANDAQYQSMLAELEQRAATGSASDSLVPTLPQTGHAVQYFNLGGYFDTMRPAPPPRRR